MDRQIVYPAGVPLDSDILHSGRNALVAVGRLLGMTMGENTVAAEGFACTPGPGLSVVVAPGSIVAPGIVDGGPYGTLPAVNSPLPRQYIARDPVRLMLPGSGTFTVYVTISTVDTQETILPFYNAADPDQTYPGRDGDGQPLPTVRADIAVPGVGSGPPPGAVALWRVAVPDGAAGVTPQNIDRAPGAPFYATIPELMSRLTPDGKYLPVSGGILTGNVVEANRFANGDLLWGGQFFSKLLDGAGSSAGDERTFGLWIQSLLGQYMAGILSLNGDQGRKDWRFNGDGHLYGPYGLIPDQGMNDGRYASYPYVDNEFLHCPGNKRLQAWTTGYVRSGDWIVFPVSFGGIPDSVTCTRIASGRARLVNLTPSGGYLSATDDQSATVSIIAVGPR